MAEQLKLTPYQEKARRSLRKGHAVVSVTAPWIPYGTYGEFGAERIYKPVIIGEGL